MKTITQLHTNDQFSEAEYKMMEERVRFAATLRSIGRKMIPVRAITDKLAYQYSIGSDMGDAMIEYVLSEGRDIVNVIDHVKKIPAIHKEFTLDQRQWTSGGTALFTRNAENAAKQVAEGEDTLLFNGLIRTGTTYEINGLYPGAGNDEATTNDFNTPGLPLKSVMAGLSLMAEDGVNVDMKNIHLFLNRVQYAELLKSVHTGGVYEYDVINRTLGGSDTMPNIHLSKDMTAGTGLLAVCDPEFFELIVAQDVSIISEPLKGGIWGRVYEYSLPVIYDSNALCRLSVI